jgi:hypothetical protein
MTALDVIQRHVQSTQRNPRVRCADNPDPSPERKVRRARHALLTLALLLAGGVALPCCSDDDAPDPVDARITAPDAARDSNPPVDLRVDTPPADGRADSAPDHPPPKCPPGMAPLKSVCIDHHEAPNLAGQPPLVMYTFDEAAVWCQARNKRLCFDDEWALACATAAGWKYPYGNAHKPGVCNDDKTWKVYSQSKLNGWPASASSASVATLAALFAAAKATGGAAAVAADHVQSLYQGTAAGAKPGCTNSSGVFDTCGNVEEWTRRRDGGGGAQFLGNLKGRYWAESRTCQSGVKTHGNGFRFYEIGFRCCKDQL